MFTYYFLIVIIFQQLDLKWNSQNRLITSTSFIISSVFMYKLQYLGLRKIAVKKFYLTICWLIKTEQEIHQGTLSTTTETSLKKIVNVKNKFLWSLWPRNKVKWSKYLQWQQLHQDSLKCSHVAVQVPVQSIWQIVIAIVSSNIKLVKLKSATRSH